MLETSNLVRKYTHICSFRKYKPFKQIILHICSFRLFSTKTFLSLLMLAFFAKNQRFLAKIVSLLKAIV